MSIFLKGMTGVMMVIHIKQPSRTLRMAYAYLYTVKATANVLWHSIRTAWIRPVGPRQANLVLIGYASSEGSGE